MDELKNKFLDALRQAVSQAGSQTELARKIGMQQSRISDYLSERYDFENITVGTLLKIFPELEITYFHAQPHENNLLEKELEREVVEHFRRLTPAEKAHYVMLVSANFPQKIENGEKT